MQAQAESGTRVNKDAVFKLIGYEPHPGQLEIHRSSAPRRVVACGVRWGKTLCAAVEALCAALEPRERSVGWVVAPTYDLTDRVYREVELLAVKHLRGRVESMRESDRRILIRNLGGGLSEIRGKSADNPVSLLGEGLDWVVIDEAARMKRAIWESHLSQRLLDKRGWALLISTPRGKGYFFDLHRAGQRPNDVVQSWNHPSWSNPLLDKELIEAERARLPERVFNQEYGAQFIEGSGAVFRNVRECASGTWQAAQYRQRYFGGLDLAKVEDFSVLVVVNRNAEVVFADRFHKLDWSLQVARIKAGAARFNNAEIVVDTTGAGEPVYEALCKENLNVAAYPFTAKSKAALIDNLALMLEQRSIVLPSAQLWPEGIDELEAFEFSVTDSGNVRTGAPGGQHDDCVIAMALAAWQVRPSRPRLTQSTTIGMY